MKKKVAKKGKSVTTNELAEMVQRGFADMATKEDIKNFVTKDELKYELANLKSDLETMMGRHIGTFRRDYDDLAGRVKKLEHKVFEKR